MAEDQGIEFGEAFGQILGSELGKQLYEGRENAPYGSPFQVAKHHETVNKRQQERDAERYAQQTGISLREARVAVQKYYEDLK